MNNTTRPQPGLGAWCRLPDGTKRTVQRVDTHHAVGLHHVRERTYVGFRVRPDDLVRPGGKIVIGCCYQTRSSQTLYWVRSDKVTVLR